MEVAVPSSMRDMEKWRSLFELGDRLLSTPDLYQQIEIIQSRFSEITGSKLEIFLHQDFKPLSNLNTCRRKKSFSGLNFVKQAQLSSSSAHWVAGEYTKIDISLNKENSPVGYLRLFFNEPLLLSKSDLDYLSKAGSYFAKILDLARLTDLKDWRLEQLSLVRQVSNEIVQLRNPDALFPYVVELIQKTFHFYFVVLYTTDSETKKIWYRSSAGKQLTDKELEQLTHSAGIDFGEGLIGICAEKGEQILSPDVRRDEHYREVPGLIEARSELCLPLNMGDKVLGVLEILSDQVDRFHEKDILVLKILADNVALAIENANLFDDLLEQSWVSTLVLQVSEAAQRLESVDDLFDAVVRMAPILTGVRKCAIYLLDKQSSDFILNAHHGFDQKESPELAMLPYAPEAKTVFKQALADEFPTVLKSSQTNTAAESDSCFAVIPLTAHGEKIGILLVDDIGEKTNNNSAIITKRDALMAVSRQTAMAVENLRLKESQENEAYITTILLQVAELVASSTQLDETIEKIVNLLPLVVGVDTVFMYLLDEAKRRFFLNAKLSYQWKNHLRYLPHSIQFSKSNELGQVLKTQRPCFFKIGEEPIENWIYEIVLKCKTAEDFADYSDTLLMVFPLFATNEGYGLLFALESEEGIEYREKKIEIIEGIARHISLAIQNENLKREMIDRERIKREMQLAQEIQRTFLPEKLPSISGWQIAASWQPAQQVGGDFYDAFLINEDELAVVIADVSDKGMPAALYMTVSRTQIHAEGKLGSDPADTLKRVNDLMVQNSREGLFVTCFYAVINLRTGAMMYANAGHNPPLWFSRGDRKLHWLEKGGMPLGVDESNQLVNEQIQINPGDQIILYTDGVVEAQTLDGQQFGEQRLFSAVDLLEDQSVYKLIEDIELKVLDFRGSALPSDDLTLLALERAEHQSGC